VTARGCGCCLYCGGCARIGVERGEVERRGRDETRGEKTRLFVLGGEEGGQGWWREGREKEIEQRRGVDGDQRGLNEFGGFNPFDLLYVISRRGGLRRVDARYGHVAAGVFRT